MEYSTYAFQYSLCCNCRDVVQRSFSNIYFKPTRYVQIKHVQHKHRKILNYHKTLSFFATKWPQPLKQCLKRLIYGRGNQNTHFSEFKSLLENDSNKTSSGVTKIY